MGFTVEQDCPQCGAPAEIDEADRLLRCPYCEVRSFLFTPDYFRFVLPHKTSEEELIYAPYLRFRGFAYYCQGLNIGHRIVDITNMGMEFDGIPFSLGVRPQTLKMKFITPEIGGSFLRFTLDPAETIARATKLSPGRKILPISPEPKKPSLDFDSSFSDPSDLFSPFGMLSKAAELSSASIQSTGADPGSGSFISDQIFHHVFIGETLSIIYLPLYVEGNGLFDAVVNQRIAKLAEGQDIMEHVASNPQWELSFLATLCPQCGWDLQGERDSVVLTCNNCNTAWEASEGKFVPVEFQSVPGEGERTLHLPFWKISATAEGVDINSFADFVRVTGLTVMIQPEWETGDMNFWVPAFKMQPKLLLDMAHKMTFAQYCFDVEKTIPDENVYPVTLPRSEAAQCLKMILANATIFKQDVFPLLPEIMFNIKDVMLVYLPFTDSGYEVAQQQVTVSIMKSALEHGRNL